MPQYIECLWLVVSSEDQRSFGETAALWAATSGQSADLLMVSLVGSFWKGEFERDGTSDVFSLDLPDSPHFERRPGNYAINAQGLPVKVGDDFRSRPTAERKRVSQTRRVVAEGLCGVPELIPWGWEGREEGLLGFSTVPLSTWPADMRNRYASWRIRRADFFRWYEASPLRVLAQPDQFWPAREDDVGREDGAKAGARAFKPGKPRAGYSTMIDKAVDRLSARGVDINMMTKKERDKRVCDELKVMGMLAAPCVRTLRRHFNRPATDKIGRGRSCP